jgi:uncharacterized protein YprB with RNaseH-like and TPR domain
MAGDLKKRLERLRKIARAEDEARVLGLSRASELAKAPGSPELEEDAGPSLGLPSKERGHPARRGPERPGFLNGWDRLCDLVWARSLSFEDHLPDSVDPLPFRAIARMRAGLPSPLPGPVPAEDLRFFDLETTGLSGGSGTVAFLAAVGRRLDGAFVVRQFFLEDYPGEPAFVAELLAALDEGSTIVTYNGRAFDLPLLRTRCVMNGILPPRRDDVDALFAARRLWKSVHGGASLGLLEREVLGIERGEDVSGSLIPEIWFSYLRKGDDPAMGVVMTHNADDVAGLARLTARAAAVFSSPRSWLASSSLDRTGLGRTLLALGRHGEAEELLEAALGDGDEVAGLALSRHYRSGGRQESRRRVLEMLPSTPRSCVERAKFLEHVARDPRAALAWAERAVEAGGPRPADEGLAARMARLQRKIAKSEGA